MLKPLKFKRFFFFLFDTRIIFFRISQLFFSIFDFSNCDFHIFSINFHKSFPTYFMQIQPWHVSQTFFICLLLIALFFSNKSFSEFFASTCVDANDEKKAKKLLYVFCHKNCHTRVFLKIKSSHIRVGHISYWRMSDEYYADY